MTCTFNTNITGYIHIAYILALYNARLVLLDIMYSIVYTVLLYMYMLCVYV